MGREIGNLVLSRRKGETICVGDDITIEIVRICGSKVVVKTSAPKDKYRIDRGEVRRAILADGLSIGERCVFCDAKANEGDHSMCHEED